MDQVIELLANSGMQTLTALAHNWPYLLASVSIAAVLKAFVDSGRVAAFLRRFRGASVLAATGAAVATPFCSCGTTAVVLGMMASTMPLAPIVAFMVASPLSSPEELFYSAGLFGWPFAISYFAASILLGISGGCIAGLLEKKGLLKKEGNSLVFTTSDGEIIKKFRKGWERNDDGCLDTVMKDFGNIKEELVVTEGDEE